VYEGSKAFKEDVPFEPSEFRETKKEPELAFSYVEHNQENLAFPSLRKSLSFKKLEEKLKSSD